MWKEDPGTSVVVVLTAEEPFGLVDCDPVKEGLRFGYCPQAGLSVSIEIVTIPSIFNIYRRHKNELRVIPAPTESYRTIRAFCNASVLRLTAKP